MRRDGLITAYTVEALLEVTPGQPRWATVDAGSVLFKTLTFEQKRGKIGDKLRAIVQDANNLHLTWGIYGTDDAKAARACVKELRKRAPHYKYRIAIRVYSRETVMVV